MIYLLVLAAAAGLYSGLDAMLERRPFRATVWFLYTITVVIYIVGSAS